MLPYLNLLGLAIPLAPFSILLGLWLGLTLAEKQSPRHQLSSDHVNNLVFTGLLAGILGARLSVALQFPQAFLNDPGSLLSLNYGLFDLPGGLAVGVLAMLIYGQRKQMAFWPTLDALTPLLAVVAVSVHFANAASGAAYGAVSSLPWSISLWGAQRHPVQLYEFSIALLILFWWFKQRSKNQNPGSLFLKFIFFTALSRLFFEAFRSESLSSVYNLRWVQLLAWGLAFAASLAIQKLNQTEG